MPNAEQIRKTQERRAARAKAKTDNVQAAEDQEHELAALSDRLRAKKTDPDAQFNEAGLRTDQIGMAAAVDDSDPEDAPQKGKKAKSRSAQREAIQIAAAAQAEADVQATVAPPTVDEHDLSIYRSRGEEPPLHVLNAIAKQADKAMRDEATEAAQAAGRAAYDVLTERRNVRNHESRHKTIEQAERLKSAAAAKSQVGAADPEK